MKKLILAVAAMFAAVSAFAVVPHRPNLPKVDGYVLLLGDCHVHTVFSDDTSWPTTRIDEADYDGLDFICITDHLDTRHQKMVNNGTFNGEKVDRNTSYEIAKAAAKKYGIMVVHGAELTRGICFFPGHFNTLFIKDANKIAQVAEAAADAVKAEGKGEIEQEEAAIWAGLKEARAQGAYLQWNHPDWEKQAHNETVWWPIHEQLYQAGLMDGIEIINRFSGFDPEAFGWAVEKNLGISAGTDCHKPMFQLVDYMKGDFRPYTVVFAKDRSLKAIREAMDARRVCTICDGCMYGPADLLESFVRASLQISDVKITDKKVSLKVKNLSSVPMTVTKAAGSENVIYPRLTYLNADEELNFSITGLDSREPFGVKEFDVNIRIENFLTNVNTPLTLTYHVTL